ncbi:hypothetical protein NA56DRAFT_88931 [Hyaloscypha hepaticicola]|uniref:Uncharacterized protein n=1 Tax=Hyaloscypha hepaticicola TaxID=2082293 RepID=A0A2J6Q8C1_9HELO|nr:hypothetical protein NA56DRAFT_88931 [Hyaloscypha hepaticicola]
MVQDITRKCLLDLVRDWQTSEFANPGSFQSANQAAGPIHEAYSPHHPTDLDENPSFGESSDLNTRNRQSETFTPSNTNSSFNHSHFLQSVEDNHIGAQNEERMYRTTFDRAMCTDSNPSLVESSISGGPFCLEVPPHPDPQRYEGKGKEPENVSIEGQDFLCAICFPGS